MTEQAVDRAGPPTLLHFHQFKNGGSTLDWVLQRNFGDRFTEHHGEGDMASLKAPQIEQMLDTRPGFVAYSSHHFRPPLPSGRNLLPLWLIRHPMDRVPSIYEQERRAASNGPDDPPFPAFVDWFEQTRDQRPYMFCDAQVALIGNSGRYTAAPTPDALRAALRELDGAPFVGVVDDYARSMVVLEALLRRWWPTFDAAYRVQNESRRESTLQTRLAALLHRLGSSAFIGLAERNRLDMALYRYARWRLAVASARLPDLPARLQAQQRRGEALPAEA